MSVYLIRNLMTGFIAVNTFVTIARIGKEKRPTTPLEAAITVFINVVWLLGIWYIA